MSRHEKMTEDEMLKIYFAMSRRRIMKYRWTTRSDIDDICWWAGANESTFRTFIMLLENKWL